MNKIVSIKRNSAIFLAIVLVLGTITLLSTPSFMKDVQAQQDYRTNIYDSEYGMDNDYKDRYGKDSYESQYSSYGKDNYKSKDINKLVKKINCNNINVNLNGLGINATGAGIGGSNGGTDGSALEAASLIGNGNGNNDYGETNNYVERNNGFKFVCINNNNNTVVVGEEPIPEPGPLTCEECFTSILNPEELDDLIQATTLPDSLPELCNEFIEGGLQTEQGRTFISEYLFTSGMTALISVDKINAILDCLEEVYGVDFPRP